MGISVRRMLAISLVGAAMVSSQVEAKAIKLSMWTLFGSGAYYDRVVSGIEQYQKKHPNVKIELMRYGDINEKLKVATAAGMGPDLLVTNGGIVEAWNMQFMLKPLNAYMKQYKLENTYLQGPLDIVTRGGKLYALPWAVDANFPVIYNRDTFAEVGLPDRTPKTPDETIEFDLKLQKKDPASGKVTRAGFVPWDWFGNTLGNWAWAFGPGNLGDGDHFTLTGANTVKALEYYVKAGNVLGGAKAVEAFIAPIRWSGFSFKKWAARACVVPMVSDALKLDKNVRLGAGGFPTNAGAPGVWLGGQWLALGSRCKYPAEAFDFLAWFTTDMEIKKASRQDWFCGVRKAYEPSIYEGMSKTDPMSPILAFAATLVPQARPYLGGIIDGGTVIGKVITDVAIDQKSTPSQALAEANRLLNKLIDDKIARTAGRVKK